MKQFTGIGLLIFIGVVGWKIGENLSADALGMALGVLFGVMAGIPAALIAITAMRANERRTRFDHCHPDQKSEMKPTAQPQMIAPQTPIFVVVDQQEKLRASIAKRIEVRE